MINPKQFFEILKENDIEFYTGVPDSLLKDFCAYITDNVEKENHIINANEGASIALAAGYYLANGKPSLVYMQNSGLGNSINPLLSLADPEVYSIPMLLLIGWRGEPGKKDEPQHVKQGRVMLKILEAMEIPYELINSDTDDVRSLIEKACISMNEKSCPYALIISDGVFEPYKLQNDIVSSYSLKREEVIEIILDNLAETDVVVSTTGKSSREVFEHREKKKQGHERDFLTVGSMGHCSQIAFGIALKQKKRQVYVLDGDGSVIMHMGTLATLGTEGPQNLKHIILNNGSHDSVGGQSTAGFHIDFSAIAKACKYKFTSTAETAEQIKEGLNMLKHSEGPSLLEIRINKGSLNDLGRPTTTPQMNRNSLMEFLSK